VRDGTTKTRRLTKNTKNTKNTKKVFVHERCFVIFVFLRLFVVPEL